MKKKHWIGLMIIIYLFIFRTDNAYAQLEVKFSDWRIAANKYRNKTKAKLEKENFYDSLIFSSDQNSRTISIQKFKKDKEHANFAMLGFPLGYRPENSRWEIEFSISGITSRPSRQDSFYQIQHVDSYETTPYSRYYTGSSDSFSMFLGPDKKYKFSKFDQDILFKYYIQENTELKTHTFLFFGLRYQTFSWKLKNFSPDVLYLNFPGFPSFTMPPFFTLADNQSMDSIGPYWGVGASQKITEKDKLTFMAGLSLMNGKNNSNEMSFAKIENFSLVNFVNYHEKNMIGYGFNLEVVYEYEIIEKLFFKISLNNQVVSYRSFKNRKSVGGNFIIYKPMGSTQETISGSISTEKFLLSPSILDNRNFTIYPLEKTKTDYLVDVFSFLSISIDKNF
ncbi:MAG: hypothetical protein H7A25_01435 [Leptospiraceae bacterium]|nr:hypothetical protein [Leptospiraceae bacterium]